jgi:hypothetical protein
MYDTFLQVAKKHVRTCISSREILLQDTVIFGVCRNTLLDCVFARYHYNFVTHLPKHTAVPETESSTLLLEFGLTQPSCVNSLVACDVAALG